MSRKGRKWNKQKRDRHTLHHYIYIIIIIIIIISKEVSISPLFIFLRSGYYLKTQSILVHRHHHHHQQQLKYHQHDDDHHHQHFQRSFNIAFSRISSKFSYWLFNSKTLFSFFVDSLSSKIYCDYVFSKDFFQDFSSKIFKAYKALRSTHPRLSNAHGRYEKGQDARNFQKVSLHCQKKIILFTGRSFCIEPTWFSSALISEVTMTTLKFM